jgi:hypothetical protein
MTAVCRPETHPHVERAAAARAGLEMPKQQTLYGRAGIFQHPAAAKEFVETLLGLGALHFVDDVEFNIVGGTGRHRLYYFLHVGLYDTA